MEQIVSWFTSGICYSIFLPFSNLSHFKYAKRLFLQAFIFQPHSEVFSDCQHLRITWILFMRQLFRSMFHNIYQDKNMSIYEYNHMFLYRWSYVCHVAFHRHLIPTSKCSFILYVYKGNAMLFLSLIIQLGVMPLMESKWI